VQRTTPVRGAQSFVGVMAEVFKRPGLTAIEIAWRWAFGVVVLSLIWWQSGIAWVQWWNGAAATSSVALHSGFILGFDPKAFAHASPLLLVICLAWAVVSALGRDVLLRRLDVTLQQMRSTLIGLAVLRVLALIAVLSVWATGFVATYKATVSGPVARGADPGYVPGFALIVSMTLVLFVFWGWVSWVFRIAPILAMSRGLGVWQSLRAAGQNHTLRGKLIEINLVMGIVKVCLIVLAMVFSACPLPFESVETRTFLVCWTLGVGVLYLIASDYFHVVRAAAYLRLWQAFEILPQTVSPAEKPAS